MDKPLLEVFLRKPEPSDLDALLTQKNNPEVTKFLGGVARPRSRKDLEEWLEWHRCRTDEVLWSIICVEDGRCVGHAGLYKIDRVVRCAEFGIMVGDPSAWGQGVGYQATILAISHGFSQENLNRISLTVLDTNDRAIHLYQKVGFVEEGRLRQAQYRDGQYVDLIAMGILRHEFIHES